MSVKSIFLPTKAIVSAEEVISELNLDMDYPYTSKLEALALEATAKVNVWCDHDFSSDENVNPLAKRIALDYIFQIWYGADQHVQDRITDNVGQLYAMLDRSGEYYEEFLSEEEETE